MRSLSPLKGDIYTLASKAVADGLRLVAQHVSAKKYIPQYYKFPQLGRFDSGFPNFSYHTKDGPLNYGDLFRSGPTAPIDRMSIESWQQYATAVENDQQLKIYYQLDFIEEYADFPDWKELRKNHFVLGPLAQFVNRYIHSTQSTNFCEESFLPIYLDWEQSVLSERLSFSIWVPILCTRFDVKSFALTSDVFVLQMPDDFQLARNNQRTRNISSHETVVGAATHALVLTGWTIPNTTQKERETILQEFGSFSDAQTIIDSFFAAFRAITGEATGYSQLVVLPDDWAHTRMATLPPVYVVSTREYPDLLEDYGWLKEPLPINESKLVEITEVFSALRNAKEHRIAIASRRLNMAYLRRNDADSILDLAIGLEALFVGDSHAEITHKLALRVAALSSIDTWDEGNPLEVFGFVKKVYGYRSAVVHGTGNPFSKRIIPGNAGKKLDAVELGLSLLRRSIVSLAKHPEFLNPIALDEHLLKTSILRPPMMA